MSSLILRTTSRLLFTLLLIFSIVLLFRGHHSPGGGFAGGLVATVAWALYSLSFGTANTREALNIDPRKIFGLGLAISMVSGIVPVFTGKSFLTGLWFEGNPEEMGHVELGTPLFFDVGVYLVILGVVLNIILAIEEEQ